MKVLFMGTPDFAVPTLKKLYSAGYEIVGVFTQPDKPVGRKQIITPPPVKACAEELGIPVFQPETLRDGKALEIIKTLSPDIIAVVAYGKILPKEILESTKYGCVNGHGSLLPKYRGASPIQWAVLNGETESGITTMLMDEGMDTGDILEQAIVSIDENETSDELFCKLAPVCAEIMLSTFKKLENGDITAVPQNEEYVTYAPIIKKEMAHIDYTKSAKEICQLVRAMNSWPVAYSIFEGKRLKVFKASVGDDTSCTSGTVVINDNKLCVAAGDKKYVELLEIQIEGGKRMSAVDFLRGRKPETGIFMN